MPAAPTGPSAASCPGPYTPASVLPERVLPVCVQDELIESLRSEGRKQAAHRMMKHKRETTHHTTDEDGSVVTD